MHVRQEDQRLRERAERVIPGGMYGHESTRLLPPDYPQYFSRAAGTRLWDADGHEYIDFMCAFGPNLLGYGHAAVEAAARQQAERGDTMTGPSPVMVELAEIFVAMVTHAEWAMFCKNGTDATTMALMCARAYRGRRKLLVARGAYHGAAPWCTPNPSGTVAEDRVHLIGFDYNDPDSLLQAVQAAGDDLAGILATPHRHEVFADQGLPEVGYAQLARRLCDEHDALLIVDDVRAGFRLARDCSWAPLGVQPDLSTWGKAFANGHAISALLGSDRARAAARSLYVTGSFWFSAVAMAAAVATLREIRDTDYLERITARGQQLREGLAHQASVHGLGIRQSGPVQMPLVLFEDDPDLRLVYDWCSRVLRQGVYLHPYHNMFINAAMTEADIDLTLKATDRAFRELAASRHSVAPQANALVLQRLKAGARPMPASAGPAVATLR